MPVEVLYTVPSLVGIPLVYNMSSIVMPYARSKLKVETEPDFKSPMAFMMGKKLKTIKVSGVQQLRLGCTLFLFHATVLYTVYVYSLRFTVTICIYTLLFTFTGYSLPFTGYSLPFTSTVYGYRLHFTVYVANLRILFFISHRGCELFPNLSFVL